VGKGRFYIFQISKIFKVCRGGVGLNHCQIPEQRSWYLGVGGNSADELAESEALNMVISGRGAANLHREQQGLIVKQHSPQQIEGTCCKYIVEPIDISGW